MPITKGSRYDVDASDITFVPTGDIIATDVQTAIEELDAEKLALAGGTMAGLLKLAKGADVASANALTLGTDGNYFDITGTTAITSIGTLGIGTLIGLHFDGILTLTHHSTNLILPGGANITTAAGDEAWFEEYDTGKWRCVNYQQTAVAPFNPAAPGAIGETTSAAGTFTDLMVTGVFTPNAYENIWVPASSMTAKTTNGAEFGETEFATNDIMKSYYFFDTSTEEFIMFDIVMPENWDRGAIKAKFYWAPSDDTGAVTETVEWELGGIAISNDDAIDANITGAQIIYDTILAGEDVDLHISGATPAITIAGTPALGDLIQFEASRNVGGTDDYGADARLFGILIQYKASNAVVVW